MKNILLLFVFTSFSIWMQAQISQLDSGLVAYYPFNGNAIDESGHGNNGYVFDAQLVPDRYGNPTSAYWFNGGSSYILVADDQTLDITSKISIVGWLYRNANVPWASMVTKGGEFGEENNYTLHNSVDSGVIFTSYNEFGAGGGACQSSFQIPSFTWSFVAFTWDGVTAKLFVNEQVDTISFTQMGGAFQINNSSLYIGVDHPGSTEYFHGCLDDIRIYNRDLTIEEILYLYNGTITQLDENTTEDLSRMVVYPNPAIDKITIESTATTKIGKVSIYNICGQLLIQKVEGKAKVEMDISNLTKGIYFLTVVSKKGVWVKRFVKE